MRSAARSLLLAATLGSSSACGAVPTRPVSTPASLPVSFLPAPPLGMAAIADADRDGVPDPYDACPGLPGVLSAVVVLNGCPPPGYYDDGLGTHDRDGDGVLDEADSCPEDPGPREAAGCAAPPDVDGDGVPDDSDACRNDPGPARNEAQISGCPEAWVEGDRVRILEPVRFASGSTELLGESTPVLEGVATVLARRVDITKLRIEGHTDGRGGPVMNRRLSLGRAARVARFLVDHGVLETRLDPRGIGPDSPIDTNETEAGRATNRRVEFHVVSTVSDADAKADPSPASEPSAPSAPSAPPGPPSAAFDSSGL